MDDKAREEIIEVAKEMERRGFLRIFTDEHGEEMWELTDAGKAEAKLARHRRASASE